MTGAPGTATPDDPRERLEAAIAALEAQRAVLGDAVVATAVAPLRRQLEALAVAHGPAAERKLVTVMFADLSGFTALSEAMDPEAVRDLLNACFERLVPVVEAHGGTIDKFIGDELMALFGAPVAYEDHAPRCLAAALAMAQALERFNAERSFRLGLHFGINSGLVVVGDVGGAGRGQYSAMGDAVNVAARLVGLSAEGEIFVGESTRRLARAGFRFEPLPAVAVKGKREPLRAYRLTGHVEVTGPATDRGEILGRDRELAQIGALLERAIAGRGGVVLLVGEAGLGKSRLIAAVRERWAGRIRWAETRGLPDAATQPLQALRGALEQLAQPFDPKDPFLRELMGLALTAAEEERVRNLDPAQRGQRRQSAAVDFLVRAAQEPLALVVEDAHWLDPSSFAAVQALAREASEIALALVVALRPGSDSRAGAWADKAIAEHAVAGCALAPLDDATAATLVARRPEGTGLPRAVVARLVARAGGNPFFLEELVRDAAERGPGAADVPHGVQGVVAARIDRLPADAKRLLQIAAVIGRDLDARTLAHMAGCEWVAAAGTLALLRDRGLVRALAGDEGESRFAFQHAITHEVAYGSVLLAERASLHARVAGVLELDLPPGTPQRAARLARHHGAAGDHPSAFGSHTQAGREAAADYANDEALFHLGEAIAHAAGAAVDAVDAVRETRAEVLAHAGRHGEAIAELEDLVTRRRDSEGRARLRRHIAAALVADRRPPEALAAFEAALAELPPDDRGAEWREIQVERLWALYFANRPDELEPLLDVLRPAVEAADENALRVQVDSIPTMVDLRRFAYAGVGEKAMAASRRALAAAETTGKPALVSLAAFGLGMAHFVRGEREAAARSLGRALAEAEVSGHGLRRLMSLAYLSLNERRRGAVAACEAYSRSALAVAEDVPVAMYRAIAMGNLTWCAWRRGEPHAGLAAEAGTAHHGGEMPSPFVWSVELLPCVDAGTADDERRRIARDLLTPPQARLPEALEQAIEKVAQASPAEMPAAVEATIAAARAESFL